LGNAGLAAMQLPPGLPARKLVDTIETVATRATELTQQLLAYAGKGALRVEPLDLSRLVEEMTGLLEVSISKKVRFVRCLGRNLPAVIGDPGKIRQVVMNLILNASESIGDAPGTITLVTRVVSPGEGLAPSGKEPGRSPQSGYLCLEVTDTGCGMDQETRDRIFDPFFSTKFTGRGLGLAAVMGIVRGHGGSIDVRSQPGHGTTFTILLPAGGTPLPSEARAEALGPVQARVAGQGTILVADDDPAIREIARLILERSGFEVLAAGDGQEAVDLFRQEGTRIDSVLLDMTMPGLDGKEALQQIHDVDPTARIILMSGYSAGDVTDRFPGDELAGFLQKPFRAVELIEKVRSVLET
ncbi:MAG: response regulator, partial [Acidobacteriota bacterium]